VENTILTYYAEPGRMTSLGKKYTEMIKALPSDIKKLIRIIQGLAIHEYVASPFYGVDISEERERKAHLRYANQLLDTIFAVNHMPLTAPREPKDRLVGVCHHFAKLLLAFMRVKGIPSRMRYGFGDYFNPGFYEDHSLCEYWSAKEKRWILVDPQFDSVWQKELNITHDVLDVPRDRFLVAGDAWVKCRSGEVEPAAFGIFQGNLRGLWFIAGNIVKDVAALNKMEMLQWDAWTGMPRPNNKQDAG
jgi:Transglutaminase-like superfamily